jgi:hypothetical protein
MRSVTVTISPIADRQVPQNLYRVSVDSPEPTPAIVPGEYKTMDAVFKSFRWPINVALKISVVDALTNNRPITFHLEDPDFLPGAAES